MSGAGRRHRAKHSTTQFTDDDFFLDLHDATANPPDGTGDADVGATVLVTHRWLLHDATQLLQRAASVMPGSFTGLPVAISGFPGALPADDAVASRAAVACDGDELAVVLSTTRGAGVLDVLRLTSRKGAADSVTMARAAVVPPPVHSHIAPASVAHGPPGSVVVSPSTSESSPLPPAPSSSGSLTLPLLDTIAIPGRFQKVIWMLRGDVVVAANGQVSRKLSETQVKNLTKRLSPASAAWLEAMRQLAKSAPPSLFWGSSSSAVSVASDGPRNSHMTTDAMATTTHVGGDAATLPSEAKGGGGGIGSATSPSVATISSTTQAKPNPADPRAHVSKNMRRQLAATEKNMRKRQAKLSSEQQANGGASDATHFKSVRCIRTAQISSRIVVAPSSTASAGAGRNHDAERQEGEVVVASNHHENYDEPLDLDIEAMQHRKTMTGGMARNRRDYSAKDHDDDEAETTTSEVESD